MLYHLRSASLRTSCHHSYDPSFGYHSQSNSSVEMSCPCDINPKHSLKSYLLYYCTSLTMSSKPELYLFKDWFYKNGKGDVWFTLEYVCQRRRHIMFASPHRLTQRLVCT